MFNVALLGCWHVHAKDYAQEIGRVAGAKLAAVWDNDPARGGQLAAQFNVPFVPNLEAVLADRSIDGVIITTETTAHVEIITKAADAGKHVFTEKVLAPTVAECRQIKAALDRNRVRFCVSLPQRTFKHNLFAKKTLDSGVLGKLTYLRIRNAHGGAIAGWLPDRFYNNAEAGGGAMLDLGAHPMYLIRWLLGRPQSVVSAFTELANKGTDDNCVSVFTYKDGVVAVSETSFVSPFSPFTLEAYGTTGTLLIQRIGSTLQIKLHTNGTWSDADASNESDIPSALTQWTTGNILFDYAAAEALTEMMEHAYLAHHTGQRAIFE